MSLCISKHSCCSQDHGPVLCDTPITVQTTIRSLECDSWGFHLRPLIQGGVPRTKSTQLPSTRRSAELGHVVVGVQHSLDTRYRVRREKFCMLRSTVPDFPPVSSCQSVIPKCHRVWSSSVADVCSVALAMETGRRRDGDRDRWRKQTICIYCGWRNIRTCNVISST